MSKVDQGAHPIHISEAADSERPVVLHPEDDDLFIQTGRQVIEACRLNISIELWQHEVRAMFDRIRDWSRERSERVSACFVTPRQTKLLLFVAPRSEQFDFDLADQIAVLNRQVLRDFKVGMVEIFQVPLSELGRFVDEGEARALYAKPG